MDERSRGCRGWAGFGLEERMRSSREGAGALAWAVVASALLYAAVELDDCAAAALAIVLVATATVLWRRRGEG